MTEGDLKMQGLKTLCNFAEELIRVRTIYSQESELFFLVKRI
jgi:hypothetical protein